MLTYECFVCVYAVSVIIIFGRELNLEYLNVKVRNEDEYSFILQIFLELKEISN